MWSAFSFRKRSAAPPVQAEGVPFSTEPSIPPGWGVKGIFNRLLFRSSQSNNPVITTGSTASTQSTSSHLSPQSSTQLPNPQITPPLSGTPASLENAYKEISGEKTDTAQEDDRHLAQVSMKWIMCSARPLSPAEVVEASNASLQTSSSGISIDIIPRACRGFVIIDREANIVRFAHPSVRGFLENKGWDTAQTNKLAADACLSMLITALQPSSSSTSYNPFLSYSVYYWQHHTQLCGDGGDARQVQEKLRNFFGTPDSPAEPFLNWLMFIENKPHQKYEPRTSWRPDFKANIDANPPSILPAICHFGFLEVLRDYLGSGKVVDVNKRNKLGLSLLSIASGAGHVEVVRTLIEHGAVVNQPGGTYGYALHYASALGQESTVRALLENGADIHRMGWNGNSVLAAAALEGQDGVVRVLLENGGGGSHLNSAFALASSRENETVLRMLLENGADVSHDGQTMFDALECAATEGITANVKFLLSILKSNVNDDRELSDIGAHTARIAVTAGSMEVLLAVFEMLPGTNLDVPSKESGKTPLQIALESESGVMTSFLISKGANIRLLKNLLISQLQWASNEPWFSALKEFLGTRTTLEDPLLTPEDVLQVRSLLCKATRLPVHLVNSILDLGEYWVYTECSREENMTIAQHHVQRPYIQLPIKSRLDSPVRKIIFTMRSHDQGWTTEDVPTGTYHGSWTWFEAGITQDIDTHSGDSTALERREIQRNLTAVRAATTHTVTWDLHDGKSADWLKTLASGQTIGVYPRALYPGWVNYVERVDMRVYCAWV